VFKENQAYKTFKEGHWVQWVDRFTKWWEIV